MQNKSNLKPSSFPTWYTCNAEYIGVVCSDVNFLQAVAWPSRIHHIDRVPSRALPTFALPGNQPDERTEIFLLLFNRLKFGVFLF